MKRDKTYTYLYVFVRPEDVRSDDLENWIFSIDPSLKSFVLIVSVAPRITSL